MDFRFTEEQKILRDSARNFLEKECPKTLVKEMEEDERGYTPELWNKMADLGWMGIIFPEEYGGIGGDLLDLVVLLEEMGRACLPGPFFSTVVLGGLTILEAGNDLQKDEFLPKIAYGETILTLAHIEPATTNYDPFLITVKAHPQENDYVIDGVKLFVPNAHVADYMICVARTNGEATSREGITLFIVDAKREEVECQLLKTLSGDKQCEVVFKNIKIPKENIVGRVDEGWLPLERVHKVAAVAKCAEMVGGAQYVLEMATSYAKEREQFGRPIGSFQAVQHHCANMLIDVEGARYITYKAAWKLSKGLSCDLEVAAAKAWVSDAYKRVVTLGHQVLGGIGYMVEHDMPLYSRRAKSAELAFGDASFYRKVVAKEIGLASSTGQAA